jgi:Putative zinc-finger
MDTQYHPDTASPGDCHAFSQWAVGCPGVGPGIPMIPCTIDASPLEAFFIPAIGCDLKFYGGNEQRLDFSPVIPDDVGALSERCVILYSNDKYRLTERPLHPPYIDVDRFSSQGWLGHDELQTVEQLARTFPMGALHQPTATDGRSPRRRLTAATRGGRKNAMGGTVCLQNPPTATSLPPFDQPTVADTAPGNPGRNDECREIRTLMPEHLLHTLDDDLDQKVIDHIRTCRECHSVLMSLEIALETAIEEAEAKRNSR